VLIELFSLGITAEALRANIGSKSVISSQRGQVDPKFQVEGVAPINHSSTQKTRLYDLLYSIKILTDLSSVLSQCTRLTDGQMDRQTDSFLFASPRWHSMQHGKTVFLVPGVGVLLFEADFESISKKIENGKQMFWVWHFRKIPHL